MSARLLLALIWSTAASATELDPWKRPHSLWLLAPPVEHSRNMFELATYDDRDACLKVRKRLRVAGTLQCVEKTNVR